VLWREVPPWLMEHLLQTVPPDDRTDGRLLFPGLKEGAMRDSMMRACRAAKIPGYSPHDLRHRRGSLWHAGGMPARELAAKMGPLKGVDEPRRLHARHPPDEVAEDRVPALLAST
jgi:integrase